MFFIPMTIPEFATSSFLTVTVWTPGGAAIIFAQIWNFELKFFLDIPFIKKKWFWGCENLYFDLKSAQKCQKPKLENFMDAPKKN